MVLGIVVIMDGENLLGYKDAGIRWQDSLSIVP